MHFFSLNLWLVIVIAHCCYVQNERLVKNDPVRMYSDVRNYEFSLRDFFRRNVRSQEHIVPRAKRSNPAANQRSSGGATAVPTEESEKKHKAPERYQVASVDFDHVSSPYIITLWILTAGLAKIGFQVTPKLRMICPESCVLLLIGVAIGLTLFFSGVTTLGSLTPNVFFLYMLPPIVLDAGYFMPNRLFFDNLPTILIYAVIGTVWNAITIGFSLWAIGLTGLYNRGLPLLDTLLFSSIVSAVDPVAVLAVFEEIHVNEILYIIVFGESLLNDAVTVVLFHMFEGYAHMGVPNIYAQDYVSGVASFFVVALGGTIMGIIFGVLAAFISRFTHHVLAIEPLFVFVMAYLSYLTAELFHLSGIMALTFCGITMKNYIQENVAHKSQVTVKYAMKMLASSSETIIFVLLGVATVNNKHEWNTWFVLLTILFCLIYRALGVIFLTAIINRFRLRQLNIVEQFIMSYGGLRGAVAFALVLVIDEEVIPSKNMMVTAVISVVYFTVFVQGMTIGFFVNFLKVSKSTKGEGDVSMNDRLHSAVIDHIMAGIEGISDHLFGNFKLRDRFRYYNNKYIRRVLTNNPSDQRPKLLETHSKLNLSDALNLVKSNSTMKTSRIAEPGSSLSSVFRTYSQANANRLASEEPHPVAGDNSLLNVDLGELSYNPSFKDLADAEIHHILEDSIFKPAKKVRRYSRSEIIEPEMPSPLHHQMRMQIRRVSENVKVKSRESEKREKVKGPPNVKALSYNGKKYSHSITSFPVPHIALDACPDDEGISFTARTEQPLSPRNRAASSSRTVTETTLPWKRGFGNKVRVCPRDESSFESQGTYHHHGFQSPTVTTPEKTFSAETASGLKAAAIENKRNRQEFQESFEQLKLESKDSVRYKKNSQNVTKNTESSPHDGTFVDVEVISEDVFSTGSTETLSIEGPEPDYGVENEGFDYKNK